MQAFIQAVLLISFFELRLSFQHVKRRWGLSEEVQQRVHGGALLRAQEVKLVKNVGLFTSGG